MNLLKNKIEKLKKELDEQSKVLKNFTIPDEKKNKDPKLSGKDKPGNKN